MTRIVKRKLAVEKELLSKIEWACTFSNCEPKIKNGSTNNRKLYQRNEKTSW